MQNLRHRAVRLTIALVIAGLIASVVPVTGTVALAQNGYGIPGEGDDDTKKVVIGGMLLITAYGIFVELTDRD